jgi:general L-amino acid transport system substrate-binding protein
MQKRLTFVTLLIVGALVLSFSLASAQEVGPITQRIMDRGSLNCGGNQNLPGFGSLDDAGNFVGFDTDFCRAVAAAILGDANAVNFRHVDAVDRQAVLQSGEIDMMARNTTWTLSRDVVWTATFAPTTFYDGQGIMAKSELGVSTIEELDGGSICVQTGTTTELNITDFITASGVEVGLNVFPDQPSSWDAYLAGRCDAFTTDKSGLLSLKAADSDPGAHFIFDVTLSKEPLGPLSPQSDPQFADIIAWTVYGLITAEESGITSDNIGDFVQGEGESNEDYQARVGVDVARLLGQAEQASGSYLGIPNDFMVSVIQQVGNYEEIFDRNLGPDTIFGLGRGVNALWTDGGLLYAPPFR